MNSRSWWKCWLRLYPSSLQTALVTALRALLGGCPILALEVALIDKPCRSIEEQVRFIEMKQGRNMFIRILKADQDMGDIIQWYHRIESLFRQLLVSI